MQQQHPFFARSPIARSIFDGSGVAACGFGANLATQGQEGSKVKHNSTTTCHGEANGASMDVRRVPSGCSRSPSLLLVGRGREVVGKPTPACVSVPATAAWFSWTRQVAGARPKIGQSQDRVRGCLLGQSMLGIESSFNSGLAMRHRLPLSCAFSKAMWRSSSLIDILWTQSSSKEEFANWHTA